MNICTGPGVIQTGSQLMFVIFYMERSYSTFYGQTELIELYTFVRVIQLAITNIEFTLSGLLPVCSLYCQPRMP